MSPDEGPFYGEKTGSRSPIKTMRSIIILEVACAWEPAVDVKEVQKRSKWELTADLAHQWPQYRVTNSPVVIGTLGFLVGLKKALLGMGQWDKGR